MRELIENLIVFQFITGRYSPVMKVKDKKMRVLIFGAIFTLLTSYQLMHYMNSKSLQLQSISQFNTTIFDAQIKKTMLMSCSSFPAHTCQHTRSRSATRRPRASTIPSEWKNIKNATTKSLRHRSASRELAAVISTLATISQLTYLMTPMSRLIGVSDSQ